jgi:hypothetical protein
MRSVAKFCGQCDFVEPAKSGSLDSLALVH